MKLSVIVTTYNRPDALKKVLEGLYGQTRLPDEILVADDGSGPDTRALVAAFENRSGPAVFHVWQKDLWFRVTLVRNRVMLADRGDHLVLLDGVCIPDCHFVADHLSLAEFGFFFRATAFWWNKKHSTVSMSMVQPLCFVLSAMQCTTGCPICVRVQS